MSVMRLTHRFRVPTPVDQAYAAFSRLERIAPCFPGATVDSSDADRFAGAVAVKLGPVPLVYAGSGTYLERDSDRHRVVIEARGEDQRGLGSAVAQVTTQLHARGEHTDVEVVTELELTGKPARFGTGVVSEVSDKLLDQFTSCLAARFTNGSLTGPDDTDPDVAGPAAEAGDAYDTRRAAPVAPSGPVLTPQPASTAFAYEPPRNRAVPHAARVLGATTVAVLRTAGPVLVAVAVAVAAMVTVRVLRRR